MPRRKRGRKATQTRRAPVSTRQPKLMPAAAISDDEQSDIEVFQADIEVPLREKRISRSRSTDDVTGNGEAPKPIVKDDDPAPADEEDEDEDGEDDEDEEV